MSEGRGLSIFAWRWRRRGFALSRVRPWRYHRALCAILAIDGKPYSAAL